MFITFEGLDGSGKTTQASLLTEALENRDLPVIQTREPGASLIGPAVRSIVLNTEGIDPTAEYLLFAADRAQHNIQIKEWLELGNIVISDRYVGSSLAYQGLKGVDQDFMLDVFYKAEGLIPDVTFWVDVPPVEAKRRLLERNESNLYDTKSLEFFTSLRSYYSDLALEFGWVYIDGYRKPSEAFLNVWEIVQDLLELEED